MRGLRMSVNSYTNLLFRGNLRCPYRLTHPAGFKSDPMGD